MTPALEASIFKILNPGGVTVGTGFLVAPRLGVTCAHVVQAAGAAPGSRLELAFYASFQESGVAAKPMLGLVLEEGWSGPDQDDLAFISLESSPSGTGSQPLDLAGGSAGCEGQAFTSAGFAPVLDIELRRAGGRLGGQVPYGESLLLQLEGAAFEQGMSGAPVLNLESGRVVGVFRMYPGKLGLKQDFAYATPVERMWAHWPPGQPYPAAPDLVGSLRQVVTGYRAGLESFLNFYLGTPQEPAPFGGRQTQLDELDAWLLEGRSAYGLLVAPAGRGKSALLAHWAQALVERSAARVILIPISLRFNIHTPELVYKALAVRLGELHRQAVDPELYSSAGQWQEASRAFLQRTPPPGPPALVILDGLDELAAAPGSLAALFPRPLAGGFKVLVSARPFSGDSDEQGWVKRLEWQRQAHSFYLPLLKRDAVEEVLRASFPPGDPLAGLLNQADVIAELFRLTQGDPLLLRLYVDELKENSSQIVSLKPQDLPSIKRGLEGYLERWWKEQQKLWQAEGLDSLAVTRQVQDFLNLLAVAPGPLRSEEVAELAGEKLASRLLLEQVAAAVGRLVSGDGSAQSGYAFSHPRLADFFRERMSVQEQQHWASKFKS